MEITQLEQMIRWLDEERKRDKKEVLTLQERLEQQAQLMESQSVEMEGLRQDIAALRTELNRTQDYPEMIEKTRRDLTGSIEDFKEKIRRQQMESEKMRQVEINTVSEQMGELERKIRPMLRYDEALQAREAGEQRLQAQIQQISNELSDLTKRTEDRLQPMVYLEEQRRADARRIAALEGELNSLRKTDEDLTAKTTRLEDRIRKFSGRIEEALNVAKSYDSKIEELRVADFQREQRMKQYAEQAEQVNAEVERLLAQTQKYALLYNQNKQALEGLDAFQTRLEKRQNEISEMQRLTEERLKRQWEEWQTTFARDWQKRQVVTEDRWRRQDLSNQSFKEHFAGLDEQVKLYYREIVALWEEIRAAADRWSNALQEASVDNQEVPTERVRDLRRFAEEKHKELL
ncbi:MAG: hypothetical protein GVY30_11170 [Chloroflexi bacterium]|jgi:chromosome segregation ATPase|nr:hypothetical protein [Chloroflexota bacterium]